jgi:hypothetical protein
MADKMGEKELASGIFSSLASSCTALLLAKNFGEEADPIKVLFAFQSG